MPRGIPNNKEEAPKKRRRRRVRRVKVNGQPRFLEDRVTELERQMEQLRAALG